jgi:hypothetical protein
MRTPAAPPPTQRPIIKHMAPAIVEPDAGEPAGDATGEPEATDGAIPSDMNQLFNNLMTA